MTPLPPNPSLYEINTRIWIRQFDQPDRRATLADVPFTYWEALAARGIHIVWLMGVWKTNRSVVEQYDLRDELLSAYSAALPDWTKDDVIGSPYAIDTYELNPELGTATDLRTLRAALHERGLRLMLDFVPNHFGAHSSLITDHPEILLHGNAERLSNDPQTYYRPGAGDLILAHGRDPYFPAWPDSVQINYFSPDARYFMSHVLFNLAEMCDGIRCDMAMLVLNDIFERTWSEPLQELGFSRPEDEFWSHAIRDVKARFPAFLFMAEAYWDMEWQLQQLGFDYTYDKQLTDRLEHGDAAAVRGHLMADAEYQAHSVRFLENHDEDRSLRVLGPQRAMAAAVIVSTIPGLRFYYDGQFEGKAVRPPVQLGRAPEEQVRENVQQFYDKLLRIVNTPVLAQGQWQQIFPEPAWEGNDSFLNFCAWLWSLGEEQRLVVINYGAGRAQCRLRFATPGGIASVVLHDLLTDRSYERDPNEIDALGLYVELEAYCAHVFAFAAPRGE